MGALDFVLCPEDTNQHAILSRVRRGLERLIYSGDPHFISKIASYCQGYNNNHMAVSLVTPNLTSDHCW